MDCDEARDLIGPLADGELDASERRIVERHIGECAGCRAELAALEALSARLRCTAARPALPADLETRIRAALAAEERQVPPAPSPRGLRPGRRAIGTHLAALVAGGALAASVLLVTGRPAAPDFAEQVLATHVGAMLSDEFGTVASSDSHTVKPWFAGKLDFSPPVVDLAADGFPLVSGRVDYLAGRPVAVLDYARGAHRISLFVVPGGDEGAPAIDETVRGYTVIAWRAAGFWFAAVSDTDAAALRRFVALVGTRTVSPDLRAPGARDQTSRMN